MMKEKAMQLIGKVKLGAKRNAPELLLGGALITGTATVVLAGRASIKAKELADQRAVDTANAIKYLLRWKSKNGIEDLKKARWYINHLIDKLEHAKNTETYIGELPCSIIFFDIE